MFLHPTAVHSPVLSFLPLPAEPQCALLIPPSRCCLRCGGSGMVPQDSKRPRAPGAQLRTSLFPMGGSMGKAFRFHLCCFRSVTAKAKKSASFRREDFTNRNSNFLCWDEPVHLSDRSGPWLAAFSPPAQLCTLPLLSIFSLLQDFTNNDLTCSQSFTPQLFTDCSYTPVICCSSYCISVIRPLRCQFGNWALMHQNDIQSIKFWWITNTPDKSYVKS